MNMIARIYKQANAIGQCGKLGGHETIEELVALFRSPQGQEFCLKHGFPSLEAWREIDKAHDLSRFGIYVDAGRISLTNETHVTLVGDTLGECLRYDELKRHEVVLMHGARATVVAKKWAVVFVHKDESSHFTKEQIDNAKIL